MEENEELTPNRIVAYNLRRARGDMKQREAIELLRPYLGDISVAAYSAAEVSRDPDKRERQFTADEIVAFALAFDKPIGWFFLPPEADEDEYSGEIRAGATPLTVEDLRGLVLSTKGFGERLPVDERMREYVRNHLAELVTALSGDVVSTIDTLRSHADWLEAIIRENAKHLLAAYEPEIEQRWPGQGSPDEEEIPRPVPGRPEDLQHEVETEEGTEYRLGSKPPEDESRRKPEERESHRKG